MRQAEGHGGPSHLQGLDSLLLALRCPPAGSIPLRPELAALRQRLYKLDNKVKHDFKRDAGEPR